MRKLADWERAVVMGTLVQRMGGEVRISFFEIARLRDSDIEVYEDRERMEMVIRLRNFTATIEEHLPAAIAARSSTTKSEDDRG